KGHINALASMIGYSNFRVWLVSINKFPAAVSDPGERRMWIDCVDSRLQELPPVVRCDFVECIDDIVKRIWLEHRRCVLTAMKPVTEIIKRQFAVTTRPDQHISIQPNQ